MAFNNLTDAEAERLAILAEECGEVIHIIGKILRHGYESYDPTVPINNQARNRHLLEKELGDISAAYCRLLQARDISSNAVEARAALKLINQGYLHHQGEAK